jgi:hypothetical protein
MSDLIVIQPQVTQVTVTEDVNQVVVSSVGVQGPAGATGATGATGAAGSSGVVTVNAPLTNAGTSSAADLSISAGTTSTAGVLQLTDSVASTSTTTAATPNAVKTAYDAALGQSVSFVSSYYYKGEGAAPSLAGTATTNTTYYTPFFVPVTTTFDRIAIRSGNTHSGTASVRLGIYNSSSGKPDTVLLDAGTVSTGTSSATYTITINQQLTPGVYWLAANSQTAASINTYISNAITSASSFIGAPFASNFAAITFYSQSSVTGAFATATSLTDGTSANNILVWLRAA